jgi:hypothetical protein
MQMMQRYMPLIFAVIYIRISAGVNIYFVVSSLCRIGIQEGIFRSGVLNRATAKRESSLPSRDGGGSAPRRSIMERLADAQQRALEQQKARQSGIQAEIDMPRTPKDPKEGPEAGPKSEATKPTGAKPPPAKPKTGPAKSTASSNGAGSSNGAAKPNGAAKRPGGAGNPQRAGGANSNGGAQRGSSKAGSNGAPTPKEQPQGQPRSAKKRPRKAR